MSDNSDTVPGQVVASKEGGQGKGHAMRISGTGHRTLLRSLVITVALSAFWQPAANSQEVAASDKSSSALLAGLSKATMVPIDQTTVDLLNDLVGDRNCTISVSDPSAGGGGVTSGATWDCTRSYPAVAVTACIQWKDQGEWTEIGCNSKGKPDDDRVHTNVSAGCIGGSNKYRTLAWGASANNSGSIRAFGFIISGVSTITCA